MKMEIIQTQNSKQIESEEQEQALIGFIEDVFGQVNKPLYSVYFYPEFTNKILLENPGVELAESIKAVLKDQEVFVLVKTKKVIKRTEINHSSGCDASNFYDEEVDDEEQEYSDDEKERERKKKKKNSKRKEPNGGKPTIFKEDQRADMWDFAPDTSDQKRNRTDNRDNNRDSRDNNRDSRDNYRDTRDNNRDIKDYRDNRDSRDNRQEYNQRGN